MDTALNLREIERISLDELPNYTFGSNDIYNRTEDRRVRLLSLDKAKNLSGNSLFKTLMVLATTDGFRSLETKIVAFGPQGVTIEGNMIVPMHAIYSVNIE